MSYTDLVMFDPRLKEYLDKKIYFIKNKMTPCIPLEIEYAITSDDIKKIKRYLNNEKEKSVSLPGETSEFDVYPPNIYYKKKLHHDKMEKHGDYEKEKHDPHFENIIDYVEEKTQLPVFLSRVVHKNKSNRVYNDNNPNRCINKIREQYHSNKPLDPEIMNDLMLGVPSHTTKSYGFNDPFEHYFDYIDNDIQEPDHVVLPFPRGGISARLENKKQVRRRVNVTP
jgi:hypothetical protein